MIDIDKEVVSKLWKELQVTALPLLLDQDDTCDWNLHAGDASKPHLGLVHRASSPKFGTIFKVSIIIDGLSAEELRDEMVRSADSTKVAPWVPNLISANILGVQSNADKSIPNWHICHQHARGVPPVSDRDFVNIHFNSRLEQSSTLYELSCAVPDSENWAKSKGCVRAENICSGFLYEPLLSADSKRCRFTYLHNVDLKGYLIKSLVNLTLSRYLQRFVRCIQDRCREIAAANVKALPINSKQPGAAINIQPLREIISNPHDG